MHTVCTKTPTKHDTPRQDTQSGTCLSSVYCDGAWHAFTGQRVCTLINPDTEEAYGLLQCAGETTVDQVVTSAVRAQGAWSISSTSERLHVISQITDLITSRADDLAALISDEIGAPIGFARTAQVGAAISHLQATQQALATIENTHQMGNDPAHLVCHEAVGVAALITPWNWPLNQIVLKLGAALAAGCAIVLKPSEHATRTAIALAEIITETDLPPGVFNLLIGEAETGAQLAAHPAINMISFTGSTRGGQHVAQTAAKRFARTSMELGGKSANLLFEDCDLETALRQGVAHCFRNAGQSCNAASRMLVARPIYNDAVELAAMIACNTPVGRPSESGAHIGPLVNRRQFDHVQSLIQQGIASEARLVAGGLGRPAHLPLGFYARPAVFAGVTADNVLFQSEIFGPVLTMTPFDDEAEAIALANATQYGLAAYVQTNDAARAARVAAQLQAGMVQINGRSRAAGAPFGGVKASGYGREGGLWGIRQFQEIKSISGMLIDAY
ncbi:MAG: aldehyde dehydrogenase family protein [Pseudomonadota bacterium]